MSTERKFINDKRIACNRHKRARESDPNREHEGPADARRLVRIRGNNGDVTHYEGEPGLEFKVRFVESCGSVQHHYKGERGRERLVRIEHPKLNTVTFFEGAMNREFMTRIVRGDGMVAVYEGPKGRERKVSETLPSGEVYRYRNYSVHVPGLPPDDGAQAIGDGWYNRARLLSIQRPTGQIDYYNGACDEERKISTLWPDGVIWKFQGSRGEERMCARVLPEDQLSNHLTDVYEGAKGEERMTRRLFKNKWVWHYDGPWQAERIVSKICPEGDTVFLYEGSRGIEQLAGKQCFSSTGVVHYSHVGRHGFALNRIDFKDGETWHFAGTEDKERKVTASLPDGSTLHYEGVADHEHLVREELPSGTIRHFLGSMNQERLVMIQWSDGELEYLDGPKDEERTVSRRLACGTLHVYEGPANHEHMVMQERVDGSKVYFNGNDGVEHMVRRVDQSGDTTYYAGDQGEERVVLTVSGGRKDVTFFKGLPGHERKCTRMTHNGTVHYNTSDEIYELIDRWVGANGHVWRYRLGFPNVPIHADLPDGRRLNRAGLLWWIARRWVWQILQPALFWQSETQKQLCAPEGPGRRQDRAAFESDFGA
jgi:hypothetical protein